LRGQDMAGAAKGEWELALKATGDRKEALVMLLRLAAQWNWQSEGEDILWTIVNRYPDEQWATRALNLALYSGGRTRSLLTLFSQQLKLKPTDLSIKNNLAVTALLLDAPEFKPHDLAREVFQAGPTNAVYASTYAYSLLVQKKNPEALAVLEKLSPKDLESPAIAGYYGLALKATGNAEKAKTYFDLVAKAPLLPEERKLFGLPAKS